MNNLTRIHLFLAVVCMNNSYAQLPGTPGQTGSNCSPPLPTATRLAPDNARVAQDEEKKYVRFVYIVPADSVEKPEYRIAIENAARHVQAWYRSQLGNGMSFNLHEPVVEVYQSTHTSDWYSTNPETDWAGPWKFWFNVVNDAGSLAGATSADPNNSWVIYVDATSTCPLLQGGALNHLAAMGADDLRGLAGEPPRPTCNGSVFDYSPCRFVGGLGHELGHTLGLPHPPGCEDQQPVPCDAQSIMYLGYLSYPDAHFSEQEKGTLMASSFMDEVEADNCFINCADLVNPYFVHSAVDISVCEGSSYFAGGALQNTPGLYYDTLSASHGCDSVVVTNLMILETIINTLDVSICKGDTYFAGGGDQTTEGTYYDTLSTAAGCDSVVVTNLMVLETITNTLDVSICKGDTYFAGGGDQTIEGTYYDTLSNLQGCDSVIITRLEILEGVTRIVEATICEGEVYYAGGDHQTTAGTYYDTLTAIQGCDSVVVTRLSLSVCTAIEPIAEASLRIYPIPTRDILRIQGKKPDHIELINSMGQGVLRTKLDYIDFSGLPEGHYYVRLYYEGNQFVTRKVLLQR